jgi:hypothetical protein
MDFIERASAGAGTARLPTLYRPQLLQAPGADVAEFRHSGGLPAYSHTRFTKNYALACFDPRENCRF